MSVNLAKFEPEDSLPALTSDNLVAIADAAEKRVEAINRIKRIALAVTNPNDWVDQNGRPYLQASGAEKIARLFGISWQIDEPEFTREEDGHFSYTYKGRFSLGSATIEAIGARSSKDGFFSVRKGKELPPSEIDRNDVKKAAYTNLLGNGITRLLGIRNLTWDDLREAKIAKDAVTRVEYQTQEMSPEAKNLRDEIWKMCLEMADGDENAARQLLLKLTSFTGKDGRTVTGKSRVEDISERAVQPTYGRVKRAYEAWKEDLANARSNGDGDN